MPMMTNAIVTFFFTTITSTHKFRFASLFLPPILPDITYRFHSFIAQNSSFTNHLAM